MKLLEILFNVIKFQVTSHFSFFIQGIFIFQVGNKKSMFDYTRRLK